MFFFQRTFQGCLQSLVVATKGCFQSISVELEKKITCLEVFTRTQCGLVDLSQAANVNGALGHKISSHSNTHFLHRHKQRMYQVSLRARPGFEPRTSRTQSENHTPRPLSHPSFRSINRHGYTKTECGSGGIRTHASEETGALNQRLRPLGHAT